MPKRHPLDEVVGPNGETRERMILLAVRAGGFPEVAAEAAGLPARVLAAYLRRGERRHPPAPQRLARFARHVRQAAAQARLKVEIAVREADPKFWLQHGPGRETATRPGWTAPPRPLFVGPQRPANPLEDPQLRRLWPLLLDALTPFPEAQAATVAAMESVASRRNNPPRDGGS
jgi:hypothetical protein